MISLKTKGLVASMSAIQLVAVYLAYNIVFYSNGIKLSEIYYLSTWLTISVLSGIMFTFFKHIFHRATMVFCSVCCSLLIVNYLLSWIILGHPYAYIKLAILIGLLTGITYGIRDYIKRRIASDN
jgi:ABC-type proline/glycine betaine transport system permease subunit